MEDKFDTEIKKAQEEYSDIEIPKELSAIIENEIEKDREREGGSKGVGRRRGFKRLGVTAAACAAVFIGSVNISPQVAMAMYAVPVLGDIARVVTFREYSYQNDMVDMNVKVPNIQGTGNEELEKRINEEINRKMAEVVAQGEKDAKEYNDAVLATGGSKEDFHQVEVIADYEMKFCDGKTLSFVIEQMESIASAYTQKTYYNIDLESGRDLKISDILGENFKEIVDKSVREQIEARMKSDENQIFFGYSEDDKEMKMEGFTGIDESRTFYINEAGNVVVTFDKYEIAPGYMGFPEFEIKTE